MARRILGCGLLFLAICTFAGPVWPCSFCPSVAKEPMGAEFDRAGFVLYGFADNPKLGGGLGQGTTEFHIEKILKPDPNLKDKKTIVLDRYIPVLDKKDAPRFVVFGEFYKGKIDVYLGRQVQSHGAVSYLEGGKVARAKGREEALRYYARFLDYPEEAIAEDAFLEFARSKDEEIGKVAKHLDPKQLRKLLERPKLELERYSLFAFLLGNCGQATDVDFLRSQIDVALKNGNSALDGLLGGYIAARPKEGWKVALSVLNDKKQAVVPRLAALRTVRFYNGWQPTEARPYILAGYKDAIPDPDIADFVIEDLRQWRIWDMTKLVLEQYRKPSHAAPIMRRAIVRYTVDCPLPEARAFLEQIRKQDPELVRDVEELLNLHKR
ncbi:MAG: hypothetical protein L0Y72_08975 [Gemmataceae bacterium]|nr:hypothetical protein [Gemmataceae bacterium]MCI0739163.1 hypothetical protein [Gemmataceae bacterium]